MDPFGLKECPTDYLGAVFGLADVAAGVGAVGLGAVAFFGGAVTGTDDGALGVATMGLGLVTMYDGALNFKYSLEGTSGPSGFEKVGGTLLGAEGATIGKIANAIPTPTNLLRAIRNTVKGSLSDKDTLDAMNALDDLQGQDPCGCP